MQHSAVHNPVLDANSTVHKPFYTPLLSDPCLISRKAPRILQAEAPAQRSETAIRTVYFRIKGISTPL